MRTLAKFNLLFLPLILPLMMAERSAAQLADEPPARTISTSGEATVFVVPDEIIVRVGIVTAEPELDAAKTANEEAAKRLLPAVKETGVEERYIQTDRLSVDIDYKTGGPTAGVDGYVVRRNYAITLKDPTRLEALVDAALGNGANVLDGVEYRTTKLREHRDAARRMAAEAAREKAVDLAEVYGMTVGLPRTINEHGVSYFGGYWGGRGYSAMTQNSIQYVGQQQLQAGETIPLGQIAISATISATFDLAEGEG